MPVSGEIQSPEGALPWLAWPAGSENARLYFLPGMGSAPGEFAPLGEALAMNGISVYSSAVRGQGLDPVIHRRGCELNLDQIAKDVEAWLEQTPTPVPVFLGGESMGSLLAMALSIRSEGIRRRISGLVAFCPVVELRQKTPELVIRLVRVLARWFPRASLHPGLFIHGKARAPQLTVDQDYQKYLSTAPFRLPRVGLGFYAGMAALMDRCLRSGNQLSAPLLVLGGANDPYISPEQLETWMTTVAAPRKQLRIFPNSYHLLLRDPDRAEVLAEIQSFVSNNSSEGNGACEDSRRIR